jgi:hypothetical protein
MSRLPLHASPEILSSPSPAAPARVGLLLAVWSLLAGVVGASGVLAHAVARAPLVIPATIWALVLAVLVLHARWAPLREWTARADLRVPILLHALRVPFGVAFLVLATEGRLHERFAAIAGPGDIVVGLLALPAALLVGAAATSLARRRAVLAWNAFALLDILAAMVAAAQALLSPERARMVALVDFPFFTLPLLVVPLIVLTHLWVFARLLHRR